MTLSSLPAFPALRALGALHARRRGATDRPPIPSRCGRSGEPMRCSSAPGRPRSAWPARSATACWSCARPSARGDRRGDRSPGRPARRAGRLHAADRGRGCIRSGVSATCGCANPRALRNSARQPGRADAPDTAVRRARARRHARRRDRGARLQRHAQVGSRSCRRSRPTRPIWYGRDSGLVEARAAVICTSFPRGGIPRPFADYEDFALTVERVQALGECPDHSLLWWDVRPHPGARDAGGPRALTHSPRSRTSPRSWR